MASSQACNRSREQADLPSVSRGSQTRFAGLLLANRTRAVFLVLSTFLQPVSTPPVQQPEDTPQPGPWWGGQESQWYLSQALTDTKPMFPLAWLGAAGMSSVLTGKARQQPDADTLLCLAVAPFGAGGGHKDGQSSLPTSTSGWTARTMT